jgi:hypothetical protein
LAQLQIELSIVNKQIAEHDFNSAKALEAQFVIEEYKGDRKKIEEELKNRDLPTLVECGKTVFFGMFAFGRLHRKRQRLEGKIRRINEQFERRD